MMRSCIRIAGVVYMVLTIWVGPVAAKTIYVDGDAPSGGDGMSWTTAYRFLQDGLLAGAAGDESVEIRVAQGMYRPDCNEACPEGTGDQEASFFLAGNMSLRGGFAGILASDPNEQDTQQYQTILSGDLADNDADVNDPSKLMNEFTRRDNSRHVLTVSGWEPPSDSILTQEDIWSHANVIEGVIITEGHAPSFSAYFIDERSQGGGLVLTNGYSIIKDCLFKGNVAGYGGGMYLNDAAKARIQSCRFSRNTADEGGGICCEGNRLEKAPELQLIDCELSENWATRGGGAFAIYSKVLLLHCTLTYNGAGYNGGAIYGNTSHVEIVDSGLRDNMAGNSGGCIACISGTNYVGNFGLLLFSGCHLIGNRCEGEESFTGGGAIYVDRMRRVELFNCLFAGNSSRGYGGVFSHLQAPLSIVNCTAHGNRAQFGRFLSLRPNLEVIQSIVFIENTIVDNGGNEIWLRTDTVPKAHVVVEIRYSNVPGMSLPDLFYPNAELIFLGPDNLFVDPCFVAPGYWEDNSTPNDPNDDIFVPGDYHLKSQAGRWDAISKTWVTDDTTSPCIDAGDPLALLGDELWPHGDCINMGAYGGTPEASLSYAGDLPHEPNMPASSDDPNDDTGIDYGVGR